MKIRNGFVSNSSSSNFIVAFDRRVTSLKDVLEVVSDRAQAENIFTQIQEQEPAMLCKPPQAECDLCESRFMCFTGRRNEVVSALYRWNGDDEFDDNDYYDDVYDGSYTDQLVEFADQNKGKVAYFLRFADSGDGGGEVESRMRYDPARVLSKLPHRDIT